MRACTRQPFLDNFWFKLKAKHSKMRKSMSMKRAYFLFLTTFPGFSDIGRNNASLYLACFNKPLPGNKLLPLMDFWIKTEFRFFRPIHCIKIIHFGPKKSMPVLNDAFVTKNLTHSMASRRLFQGGLKNPPPAWRD